MKCIIRPLFLLFLFAITISLSACNDEKLPNTSATPVAIVQEDKSHDNNQDSIQANKEEEVVMEKPEQMFSAPNFTFLDSEGNKLSLHELRGKPVFINFWASW